MLCFYPLDSAQSTLEHFPSQAMRLGAHMSIAGGVDQALERGAAIRCDTIQIFLKNNMQWRGRKPAVAEVNRFISLQQATGITPVFAHSSYLLNLAATNARFLSRSILALIDEIERADHLGVPFIVLHPGADMGAGEKIGLKTVARSLDEVFRATRGSHARVALETTAGQGTSLGYRFEHLAEIVELSGFPESARRVCGYLSSVRRRLRHSRREGVSGHDAASGPNAWT